MANDANAAAGYQAGPAWTAAATVPSKTKAPLPCDPCCQPCPDCGGLECLCRPRFFAGQLLTEEDLNRLDQYIKAKNQLHNRYLFGSGVVCGLEVRCNPCGDTVTVMPGYALSPCGDDIIVCKKDSVDICSLISCCTPVTGQDCRPYAGDDNNCKDVIEDWILAIRYEEKPSRGITPLTGQGCGCSCGTPGCTGSGGGCSCGKSGCSGGCGCGGVSQGASCCGPTKTATQPIQPKHPRRGAPPSCEPTVICEGYRYEVFRAPVEKPVRGVGDIASPWVSGISGLASQIDSKLFQNIACCVEDLSASIPPLPTANNQNPTPQAWYQWCCRVKAALAQHFIRYGGTDCEALYLLQTLPCPDPNSQNFQQALDQTLYSLVVITVEGILACFCSAALPPCACPDDPRVPLALVRVRKSDCSIVSVCNWTPLRKFVITFPTLNYWFGWLPFGKIIRDWMHSICCTFLGLKPPQVPGNNAVAGVAPEAMMMNAAPGDTAPQSSLSQPVFLDAGNLAPSGTGATIAEALFRNLGDAPTTLKRSDLVDAVFKPLYVGTGAASTQQNDVDALAAAPAMKTLSEIFRPLTQAIPAGLFGAAAPASDAKTSDVDALKSQIAMLQKSVADHESQIAALKSSSNNNKKNK